MRDVKIEKIDENKIKVVLNYDDILNLNLDITEISPESVEAEKLFSDMLNLASKECGFKIDDSKFMIEAIPSYKEGFVMFVTKLQKEREKLKLKEKLEIYSFLNLEILKFAFNTIRTRFKGDFAVYRLDGLCYLTLLCEAGIDFELIKVILLDFGKQIKSPELFKGILDEYGEKIPNAQTACLLRGSAQ
jgi:negative regulator of genetic competence, sporulation and motility